MTKTWLITGTSSGFGKVLATQLLERGDRVAGTSRRIDALSELSQHHPRTFHAAQLDVTDTTQVHAVVNELFRTLGHVDVVISNAGYATFGAAEELTDDMIRRQVATNLVGSIDVIRAVLPHFRAQGAGRIVQMSSEGGLRAYPNGSLYHATKWGIEGFVESVSQEVGALGIQMMLVEPGPSATQFAANLDMAAPMAAYASTPSGQFRDELSAGRFTMDGDPVKMARHITEAVDGHAMPLRLVLGATAFTTTHEALTERLAQVVASRDAALSSDSHS